MEIAIKGLRFQAHSFFREKAIDLYKTLKRDEGIREFTKTKIYLNGDSPLHSAYLIYFEGGKKLSKGKEVDESKLKGTIMPNASKTQDSKQKGYGL